MSNNTVTVLRNLLHAWALISLPVDTNLDALRFECMSPNIHAPRLRVINFCIEDRKIFSCKTDQLENTTAGKYWVTHFFNRFPEEQLMRLEQIRETLRDNIR